MSIFIKDHKINIEHNNFPDINTIIKDFIYSDKDIIEDPEQYILINDIKTLKLLDNMENAYEHITINYNNISSDKHMCYHDLILHFVTLPENDKHISKDVYEYHKKFKINNTIYNGYLLKNYESNCTGISYGCFQCSGEGCIGCYNCENCNYCYGCSECENSNNLLKCTDCKYCSKSQQCDSCILCKECKNCYKCEKCKNCCKCNKCEDCEGQFKLSDYNGRKYCKACGVYIYCICSSCNWSDYCLECSDREHSEEVYSSDEEYL